MRRNSQLVFRVVPPKTEPENVITIALHDLDGGMNDLIPLVSSLDPSGRIVVPEAARAVFNGMEIVAHTWYGGNIPERPELISFGDSLAQLERFLVDQSDDFGTARFRLFGWGQGAFLALTLARVLPEMISEVVAVKGWIPPIPEEALPPALPLKGISILLVNDPANEAQVIDSANALTALEATVSTIFVEDLQPVDERVAPMVRSWLAAAGSSS